MMIQDSPGQMESDLADLGQVWESWGGVWGGHFKDPIHFEYPGFTQPKLEEPIDYVAAAKTAGKVVLSLATPVALQYSTTSFEEEARGSFGSKILCRLGVKSFC